MMFISVLNLLDVFANKVLFKVPFVAKIPMLFVLVFKEAGLIAGSIPINGTLYFSLKCEIAFVVAVLQAITIILQFLFNRNSVFFIDKSMISSLLF